MDRRPRIFLLSPARANGRRAELLLRQGSQLPLALRLRSGGVPIGEIFSFLSGLYFRGKLAYAEAFARPPAGIPGVHVITPDRGLLPAGAPVTHFDLVSFGTVEVSASNPLYRRPLEVSVRGLALAAPQAEVVLLGSIATGKYADLLLEVFGASLLFPVEFVGRGDMSRGGLLLRSAAAGLELTYAPLLGAPRHGPKPPRLGSP